MLSHNTRHNDRRISQRACPCSFFIFLTFLSLLLFHLSFHCFFLKCYSPVPGASYLLKVCNFCRTQGAQLETVTSPPLSPSSAIAAHMLWLRSLFHAPLSISFARLTVSLSCPPKEEKGSQLCRKHPWFDQPFLSISNFPSVVSEYRMQMGEEVCAPLSVCYFVFDVGGLVSDARSCDWKMFDEMTGRRMATPAASTQWKSQRWLGVEE